MLTFSPLEPLTFDLRRADLSLVGEGREPGVHMSECVRAMMEAAGEKLGSIEGEDPAARPQAGFWYEAALAWAMRQQAAHEQHNIDWQVRLCLDRVHMTPDGVDYTAEELISVKATGKSMKRWVEGQAASAPNEHQFWYWLVADICYARAAEKLLGLPIRKVRYYFLWFNGDYSRKPGHGCQTNTCVVRFEPPDAEALWQIVLRYRDFLEAQRRVAA